MLRQYPARVLIAFGHARIFLHLNATDVRAKAASLRAVQSSMHSDYKAGSTAKALPACCPVGVPWYTSVSDGYPGAISDPVQTKATRILKTNIPKGAAACVDKGFPVENLAAEHHLKITRPVKRQRGQQQQSEVETDLTGKIGNARIVIE